MKIPFEHNNNVCVSNSDFVFVFVCFFNSFTSQHASRGDNYNNIGNIATAIKYNNSISTIACQPAQHASEMMCVKFMEWTLDTIHLAHKDARASALYKFIHSER